MPPTPEQRAREAIDALLIAAGWILQDNADFNRNAGEGVAVREFVLPNGPCDYLLFVGGKAAGVVETAFRESPRINRPACQSCAFRHCGR